MLPTPSTRTGVKSSPTSGAGSPMRMMNAYEGAAMAAGGGGQGAATGD